MSVPVTAASSSEWGSLFLFCWDRGSGYMVVPVADNPPKRSRFALRYPFAASGVPGWNGFYSALGTLDFVAQFVAAVIR